VSEALRDEKGFFLEVDVDNLKGSKNSKSPQEMQLLDFEVRHRNSLRFSIILAGVMILLVSWRWAQPTAPTSGELLYRKGILTPGTPLAGDRESGGSTSGDDAACVNCHRPSGLGTVEGRTVIPPITAKYLFNQGVLIAHTPEAHRIERNTAGRSPYTDATLVRAIRDGIDPDGRTLDYLMPRYKLDDATMNSLVAYLKQLSSGPVPGVTADTMHFATIITPDADPVKRKGMLDVLEHFVAAKNVFYRPIPPPVRPTRMEYRVPHKWQLHVWELTGEPDTWGIQLRNRLKAEPVFAVISGLGGKDWKPVHQFCQQESIPCLFPNVDLPIIAEGDFYDVYFSRGVLLEAQLIARQLRETAGTAALRRVVQVYRGDDIGAAAAKVMQDEIVSPGLTVIERPLTQHAGGGELTAALEKVGAKDALILWLRPDDLRDLPAGPPATPAVFVSGLMGGLEDSPIPESWRGAVHISYPFELPARRSVLLNYPLGWFRIQRIPVVAEQTQIDTFIACNIVSESLSDMLDNFVRDYLIENIEVMLSTRIINGYYTRLGLAPGQRFASKGGYIVRFAAADGKKLIPEGDWIVP
jgi:hypothetical protein